MPEEIVMQPKNGHKTLRAEMQNLMNGPKVQVGLKSGALIRTTFLKSNDLI